MMYLLVEWDDDGSMNCVSASELELMSGREKWLSTARVRMWWAANKKWYNGRILDTEISDVNSRSDEDMPLAQLVAVEDNVPLSTILKRSTHE